MKKADAESHIFCRIVPPSPDTAPNLQILRCQNATMSLFAERLQNLVSGLNLPVQDATGLEGGWDFTLAFNPIPPMMFNRPGPPGDSAQGLPTAADPVGGCTIFESIEKQLGLKLEPQKRTLPVVVIDRIQQKPTDN